MNTTTDIDARFARLERQNRRLRAGFIGLAGVMLAGAAVGWSAGQTIPDLIQARSFEVVNGAGEAAVGLWSDDDGGKLTIFDADTDPIAIIAGTERGGSIIIVNAEGLPVALIRPTPNGTGEMFVKNAEGVIVAGMTATDDGAGYVVVSNPATGEKKEITP